MPTWTQVLRRRYEPWPPELSGRLVVDNIDDAAGHVAHIVTELSPRRQERTDGSTCRDLLLPASAQITSAHDITLRDEEGRGGRAHCPPLSQAPFGLFRTRNARPRRERADRAADESPAMTIRPGRDDRKDTVRRRPSLGIHHVRR